MKDIKCSCGHVVNLIEFTNTCICGADYSQEGTRLSPRSEWGKETGETVEEILAIGHHIETEKIITLGQE